jgi:prepilin-type N-terminal cleavage/methylation domain-containing protein
MNQPATRHHQLATRRRPAAFTLIELLVVIAIIAILAGLGFAGMQGAIESGKKAQARNDVNQIAAAVKAYSVEFGRLPAANPIPELIGGNPRKIVFLEPKSAKGNPPKGGLSKEDILDPWGKKYTIKLDDNYDNRVDGHLTTVVVQTTDRDQKVISNVQ